MVRLKYNQSWPITRAIHNAVVVTFVAGYTSPSAVPETVKQEVLYWVSHFYERRENLSERAMHEVANTGNWLGWMNHAKGVG